MKSINRLMCVLFILVIFASFSSAQPKYSQKTVLQVGWGDTGERLGKYTQGTIYSFPADFIVDNNGNLFIADTVNHRIVKYDNKGNYIKDFGANYQNMQKGNWYDHIGVDGQNNVYVLDWNNVNIIKFDNDGNYQDTIPNVNAHTGAAINVTTLGDVYVNGEGKIMKYQKTSGAMVAGEKAGKYTATKVDTMYESPKGNIYKIKRSGKDYLFEKEGKVEKGQVKALSKDETFSKQIFRPNRGEKMVGFDSNEKMYVVKGRQEKVAMFAANGDLEEEMDLPANKGIKGIRGTVVRIDNAGNIYKMLYDDNGVKIVKMEKVGN